MHVDNSKLESQSTDSLNNDNGVPSIDNIQGDEDGLSDNSFEEAAGFESYGETDTVQNTFNDDLGLSSLDDSGLDGSNSILEAGGSMDVTDSMDITDSVLEDNMDSVLDDTFER